MYKILVFLRKPIVMLALLAIAGIGVLSGFQYIQEQREVQYFQKLSTKHPNGETYVAEILQARLNLKDSNKENDVTAFLTMGVNLNLLGEKQKALSWYEKVLEQDPVNFLALNNTANIYDELGMYDQSEATWLKLIAAYSDKTSSYRSLGYLYWYRMQKAPETIESLFQKGLAITSNSPDLLNWLTAYFLETGNNKKFVEYANLLNAPSK